VRRSQRAAVDRGGFTRDIAIAAARSALQPT